MERFFKHYYERMCIYDYELLEMLYKSNGEVNPELFRQEGDFIITKTDDRVRKCVSMDEVIRIPDGVRSVGYDVFNERDCPNVKHIIFPESVEGICPYAVMGNTVEEITLNNKYIYISDDAFAYCYSLRLIHHIPERCTIHVLPRGGYGPQTVKIVPINLPAPPPAEDLPF